MMISLCAESIDYWYLFSLHYHLAGFTQEAELKTKIEYILF